MKSRKWRVDSRVEWRAESKVSVRKRRKSQWRPVARQVRSFLSQATHRCAICKSPLAKNHTLFGTVSRFCRAMPSKLLAVYTHVYTSMLARDQMRVFHPYAIRVSMKTIWLKRISLSIFARRFLRATFGNSRNRFHGKRRNPDTRGTKEEPTIPSRNMPEGLVSSISDIHRSGRIVESVRNYTGIIFDRMLRRRTKRSLCTNVCNTNRIYVTQWNCDFIFLLKNSTEFEQTFQRRIIYAIPVNTRLRRMKVAKIVRTVFGT